MARKKVDRTQDEIREYPCYSIEQVASYIGVPKRTLRNWVTGYSYQTRHAMKRANPVITPADPENNLLSFYNLAEAQVLAATRERNIGLRRIRHTVEYMREVLQEERPLLRCVFETSGQDIFLQNISGKNLRNPLNVSKFGQYGFRSILKKYLSRIERDANGNPTRVYPLKAGARSAKRNIVIHPFVSAGKPSLAESGIMVEAIWKRKKAGETVKTLAKDFRLKPSEIKAAINYYAA
ncbi:uncharacterized protein (DUF433 family) [Silvibacterium bohemicum]|uniref:Uncharacterized protein (DUF433 family) n=1 Tax=Silvibacterium bohemicum TaxID=1577686 RepID=A0A841JW27_9BACT|nr:DUF433 domain-containing protein [Silvibacterium bohemicum]MBB6145603.1 uncharacterized protein (DUF433 family) [Silvibacterium bohemicum]